MKQFQVPQFIDVEDKILGFVTLRQFFIMLIPLVVGGILYFILNIWMVIFFMIPTTAICAIFAFYKPNGMRFSRFLGSFLSYTFKPRLYVWKREESVVYQGDAMDKNEAKDKKDNVEDLKKKKGYLETGSKVDEVKLQEGDNDEYLEKV